MQYIAFIEAARPGQPQSWSAYFPDVPGCVAAADTYEETVKLVTEALALHLAGLAEDGDPMPVGRRMQDLLDDPDHAPDLMQNGGMCIPQIVSIAPPATERVRVNITIAESLLAQADKRAKSAGVTRSRFIEDALLVALEG